MISALEYCHQNLVIHRDLKPENILLDKNNNVKIVDFGLSKMMEFGQFLRTNCGTPVYSAPEVLSSKKYIGPEVDVWALGCIVYSMVTGYCPWNGANLQDQIKNAMSGTYEEVQEASPAFGKLLHRILTVDPMERPTLRELRNHPWVNRGHSSKPVSCIPSVDRPTMEYNEDILRKMQAIGFSSAQIKKDIEANNRTSQTYVIYFMMLDNQGIPQEKSRMSKELSSSWGPTTLQAALNALPRKTSLDSHLSAHSDVPQLSSRDAKDSRQNSKDGTTVTTPIAIKKSRKNFIMEIKKRLQHKKQEKHL